MQTRIASELIRCVVLESGSLPLTESDAEKYDQTIVIAQMLGESASEFAERTLERLAGVERSGRCLESATLLAGDHDDPAARAARRQIVRALAAGARARRGVTPVTLHAASRMTSAYRAELLGLAEELAWGDREHAPIRVRFDEGSPTSRRPSGNFGAVDGSFRGLRSESTKMR